MPKNVNVGLQWIWVNAMLMGSEDTWCCGIRLFIFLLLVTCPVGHYHNTVQNVCGACSKGTFQSTEAQTKCIQCPPLTTTNLENGGGAKSIEQCKGIC